MDDLVYDLRQMTGLDHVGVTAHKAANEIERLHRENVILRRNVATLNAIIGKMDKQLYPDG